MQMLAAQNHSRLRFISLLIPPSSDPLLTPYKKQINPKIQPMKRNFSILSNLRQSKTIKQEKLELSKKDYSKINRSYQSLKRIKKVCYNYTENEQQKESNLEYLNLVQLRKSMLKKKWLRQRENIIQSRATPQMNERNCQFFGITEPVVFMKPDSNNKKATPNQQKLRYFLQRSFYQISNRKNKQIEQKSEDKEHSFVKKR